MSRKKRHIISKGVYHIILKGNDGRDLFYDRQDFTKFLTVLKETNNKFKNDIYEYCLMTNHVHIIIFDKNNFLSKMMQSLTISYSLYFSKKYNKKGHLFQDRFFSKIVENREYLRTLCRYIHQNPSKAQIAKLEEYKWSSYKEFLFDSKIINPKPILSMFGQTPEEARKNFINYHAYEEYQINEEVEYEFVSKLSDEQALKKILKVLKIKNIQKFRLFDTKERKEKIKKLKIIKGVSKAQIARILGVNEKIVQKLLK